MNRSVLLKDPGQDRMMYVWGAKQSGRYFRVL